MRPVIVGISGASGSLLAKDTVQALIERDIPVNLVATNAAKLVWQKELNHSFNSKLSEWRETALFQDFGIHELDAPIASGTYPTSAMIVVPCSMTTVASISHGIGSNLLLRAADVTLKEQRKLILIPRETPLHAIHLDNMAKLATMGVTIMPPEPPFYLKPKSIEEIVDFFVEKILVTLGVSESLPIQYQYRED